MFDILAFEYAGSLEWKNLYSHLVCSPTTVLYLYLLTPWCRVLLEKLTGLQLVKKFPVFYGTQRFITALTSVRHLSLSWASPIQSTYPHPTSRRSILISTHLRLGLPVVSFPPVSPPRPYAPPCPPTLTFTFTHWIGRWTVPRPGGDVLNNTKISCPVGRVNSFRGAESFLTCEISYTCFRSFSFSVELKCLLPYLQDTVMGIILNAMGMSRSQAPVCLIRAFRPKVCFCLLLPVFGSNSCIRILSFSHIT